MTQNTNQAEFKIGDHVEGGRPGSEDYDHGYVTEIDGEQVTVAWEQSLVTTTQHASALRAF